MISSAVALVTGGCSGLGAAAVKCLARKGVRVLVADLPHQEELFHPNIVTPLMSESGVTKYDTGKIGEKITFHATDITDPLQVSAALDEAERVFGEPINVAVNCAGMALAIKTLSSKGPLPHPIEAFAKTLQVNTIGTFLVSTLAAERMSRRVAGADGQRGCIIQTSSIAAYEGQIGQVAYAASKAAVVGMTLPMARDLAPWGIRVVTVAPGLFATPLLDGLPPTVKAELGSSVPYPNRLGDPEEFGQFVVHLIENSYCNGSVYRLDGALRMKP